MAKNKIKKTKAPKIDLSLPKQRGCLNCPRWHAFMKRVWEEEHILCSETSCVMLNFEAKPEA